MDFNSLHHHSPQPQDHDPDYWWTSSLMLSEGVQPYTSPGDISLSSTGTKSFQILPLDPHPSAVHTSDSHALIRLSRHSLPHIVSKDTPPSNLSLPQAPIPPDHYLVSTKASRGFVSSIIASEASFSGGGSTHYTPCDAFPFLEGTPTVSGSLVAASGPSSALPTTHPSICPRQPALFDTGGFAQSMESNLPTTVMASKRRFNTLSCERPSTTAKPQLFARMGVRYGTGLRLDLVRESPHHFSLAIDPRWLDFRKMPRNTIMATQTAEEISPSTESEVPEQSPVPPLTQFDNAILDLHDPSTSSWDDSIPSSSQSFYSGLTSYLPYSANPWYQDQKDMLTDGDRDTSCGLLPLQPPIYPTQYAVDPFDSTQLAGLSMVDSTLSSSPTSFSQSLPSSIDALPTTQFGYRTQASSSSSSYDGSTYQTSCGDIYAPVAAREAPKHTTFYPQALAGNVTVVHQRRYQGRQTSRMLSGVPRQFTGIGPELGPHGYPVSSVHKGQKLAGLPNAGRRAFQDVDVGQKLSWRFLFDGFPESARQFNVLDAKKTQPTIERIVRETVKALKCFKGKEPRFVYPLHRLVILEIELVSSASVQATIGVLPAEDVTVDA